MRKKKKVPPGKRTNRSSFSARRNPPPAFSFSIVDDPSSVTSVPVRYGSCAFRQATLPFRRPGRPLLAAAAATPPNYSNCSITRHSLDIIQKIIARGDCQTEKGESIRNPIWLIAGLDLIYIVRIFTVAAVIIFFSNSIRINGFFVSRDYVKGSLLSSISSLQLFRLLRKVINCAGFVGVD